MEERGSWRKRDGGKGASAIAEKWLMTDDPFSAPQDDKLVLEYRLEKTSSRDPPTRA